VRRAVAAEDGRCRSRESRSCRDDQYESSPSTLYVIAEVPPLRRIVELVRFETRSYA
jgi:hypothetical protein